MSETAPATGVHDALQAVGYGLYVLTVQDAADVHAMTCNWLTQISFVPVLLLVAIEKKSHAHQLLPAGGVFAINLLRKDQLALARRTATPHAINPHKLAGVAYHAGAAGAPILDESLGYLECRVRQVLEAEGDHTLFVAEVLNGLRRAGEPLSLAESRLHYR